MNLLAIVGSPRKGKATDRLVDQAIQGFRTRVNTGSTIKRNLVDYDIKHCQNCLVCRDSKTTEAMARCIIRDDMDFIKEDILKSDILILGTPVHMAHATGLMTIFLERICWTFAKPEKSYWVVKGCPRPRSDKKRKAVIVVTSSIIPPFFRRFCDQATPFIKSTIRDSLNAKTVGDLYAGDLEHRGVESYLTKAFKLGQKLAQAA